MKKLLTFALTALLLACASVNVLADDAVVTEDTAVTAAEETTVSEPFAIDGMTKVEVTSSDASLDVDTGNFYDALPETKCTITFDADEETKTLSVYTATKVPEALTNFAAIVDGEKGTVITLSVWKKVTVTTTASTTAAASGDSSSTTSAASSQATTTQASTTKAPTTTTKPTTTKPSTTKAE